MYIFCRSGCTGLLPSPDVQLKLFGWLPHMLWICVFPFIPRIIALDWSYVWDFRVTGEAHQFVRKSIRLKTFEVGMITLAWWSEIDAGIGTILIAGDKRTVECGIPRKGPCPYPRMIYGQELVQCHNMEQSKWRRLTFLHHGVLLSDGHVEKTTLLHKTYGAELEPYQVNFCNIVYSWLKPWVPR